MARRRLGGLFITSTILGHQSTPNELHCFAGLVGATKPAASIARSGPLHEQCRGQMAAGGNSFTNSDQPRLDRNQWPHPLEHESIASESDPHRRVAKPGLHGACVGACDAVVGARAGAKADAELRALKRRLAYQLVSRCRGEGETLGRSDKAREQMEHSGSSAE